MKIIKESKINNSLLRSKDGMFELEEMEEVGVKVLDDSSYHKIWCPHTVYFVMLIGVMFPSFLTYF